MSIVNIIELIGIISAAISSLVALICTFKKLIPALFKIARNKDWAKIKELADIAMKEAEKSDKHGVEKQEMVLNIVSKECKALDIQFNEQDVLDLIDYIKQSIDWFNEMTK